MNGLSRAPASLAALTSLTLLLLGGNALEEVPPSLRHLRNLVELDLGSNQIYHIPPWITQLSALRVLGLRSASLRHAPPNNPATDAHSVFPDLSCLPLRELDLSDCDLRDGPSVSWLAHIHTLESLDLSDNHLHSLPGASYPPKKKKRAYVLKQAATDTEATLQYAWANCRALRNSRYTTRGIVRSLWQALQALEQEATAAAAGQGAKRGLRHSMRA
jgi:Leucine-rich repeat (LRR) protein